MTPLLSLLVSTASLILVAFAAPTPASDAPIKYHVTKRSRWESYPIEKVIAKDLGRLAHYNGRFSENSASLDERYFTGVAINEDVSYVAEVEVGDQEFYLIIDTGSSNTWVCMNRE